MPGELSSSQELIAAALLVVQVAAVLVTAAVAAVRLAGPDRLARALAGVLVALGLAVGVSLVLGMIGLLRLPAVVAVHVALAAGAIVLQRRRPDGPLLLGPRVWSPLELAAAGATALYLALGVKLSLHAARSFEFDTKEYHLANLASWLQEGHIWSLPYAPPGSMTANHPGSGEIFGVWLALPSHGDELVYLAPDRVRPTRRARRCPPGSGAWARSRRRLTGRHGCVGRGDGADLLRPGRHDDD